MILGGRFDSLVVHRIVAIRDRLSDEFALPESAPPVENDEFRTVGVVPRSEVFEFSLPIHERLHTLYSLASNMIVMILEIVVSELAISLLSTVCRSDAQGVNYPTLLAHR